MEYIRICPNCGCKIKYKYKSTYNYANKINSLCRSCGSYKKAHLNNIKLDKLLKNTNESFYWVGFILADGSITNNRLNISLSIKDIEHLKKFCNYINYDNIKIKTINKSDICSISIKDIKIINKLCDKFNIKRNKTKNPPNTILKWNNNLLISMFCGFIDGDGCIMKQYKRKDASLRIKNHKSWINILNEFNTLIDNKGIVKINKLNYSTLSLTDFTILKKLKKTILSLNIPYLYRKWNNINLNYVSKRSFIKENLNNIINDINILSRKEICNKYNISAATLSCIINKKRSYGK